MEDVTTPAILHPRLLGSASRPSRPSRTVPFPSIREAHADRADDLVLVVVVGELEAVGVEVEVADGGAEEPLALAGHWERDGGLRAGLKVAERVVVAAGFLVVVAGAKAQDDGERQPHRRVPGANAERRL